MKGSKSAGLRPLGFDSPPGTSYRSLRPPGDIFRDFLQPARLAFVESGIVRPVEGVAGAAWAVGEYKCRALHLRRHGGRDNRKKGLGRADKTDRSWFCSFVGSDLGLFSVIEAAGVHVSQRDTLISFAPAGAG